LTYRYFIELLILGYNISIGRTRTMARIAGKDAREGASTWMTSGYHRKRYITRPQVMLPKIGQEYLDTVPLESLTTPFLITNFASPCITRAKTYKFIFYQPGLPEYQNVQRIGET
jgi:hypothetical protein